MNTFIRIEVRDGEVEEILRELNEAQEKIYECYSKLKELGVLVISKGAASSNWRLPRLSFFFQLINEPIQKFSGIFYQFPNIVDSSWGSSHCIAGSAIKLKVFYSFTEFLCISHDYASFPSDSITREKEGQAARGICPRYDHSLLSLFPVPWFSSLNRGQMPGQQTKTKAAHSGRQGGEADERKPEIRPKGQRHDPTGRSRLFGDYA